MKARFIILMVFSLVLFGFGNVSKSEAAKLEPAVSIVKFDTTYQYRIHEYNSGVFNEQFRETVEKLEKEGKLIKVLTFITNVKGEVTIEHKIYYSDDKMNNKQPIHKIFFISSSPDEGEKYFINLCFEYEYVNLLHFGVTPNGLRLFVFETNI